MALSAFNHRSLGMAIASGVAITTPNIVDAEIYLSFSYPDSNEYHLDAASLGSLMSDVTLPQTTPTLTFGLSGEGIIHPYVQFNIMGHSANIIHNEVESRRPSDRLARNINKRKNRMLDQLELNNENEGVRLAYDFDAGTPVGDYLYNQLNTVSASNLNVVTAQFSTGVASEFYITERLSFTANAGVGIMAQYWSDNKTDYSGTCIGPYASASAVANYRLNDKWSVFSQAQVETSTACVFNNHAAIADTDDPLQTTVSFGLKRSIGNKNLPIDGLNTYYSLGSFASLNLDPTQTYGLADKNGFATLSLTEDVRHGVSLSYSAYLNDSETSYQGLSFQISQATLKGTMGPDQDAARDFAEQFHYDDDRYDILNDAFTDWILDENESNHSSYDVNGTSYQLLAITRYGYDFHPTDFLTLSPNLFFGGGIEYATLDLSNEDNNFKTHMMRPLAMAGIGGEALYNLTDNLSFNGVIDAGLLYKGVAIYGGEDIDFGLGDDSQTNAVVQAGLKIEYRF